LGGKDIFRGAGMELVMDNSRLEKLIPKDKFDFEPFPMLMEISEDDVKPILHKLLFCIADMSWPIATEMIRVLVRFSSSVVPHVKDVLMPTETDEEWKYFIISHLIPQLPTSSQELLLESVKRIYDNPTSNEIRGEVWEMAKEYIEGCQHNPRG